MIPIVNGIRDVEEKIVLCRSEGEFGYTGCCRVTVCFPLRHVVTYPASSLQLRPFPHSLTSHVPFTMSSQQSNASAKKIANYTQSISSGVTNLLTELGRVNTPASFDSAPIQNQLETLIALVQGMDTRLAAVEKSLQKLESDNVPGLMEIAPVGIAQMPGFKIMPKVTAECVFRPLPRARLTSVSEHNSRARRHNETLQKGNDALMPVRTANNTLAVGFPSTLGDLVFLSPNPSPHIARSFLTFSTDSKVEAQLIKAFNLSDELFSLWAFIGANPDTRAMEGTYCTPEILAQVRMDKRANRDRDIAAAGPVTASTKKAAA